MRKSSGQHLRRLAGVRLGRFAQDPPQELTHALDTQMAPWPEVLPRILIVTPSLNQGKFIGRTIDSVLGQNYPALCYRIQDGGSTDSTHELLAALDPEQVSIRIEHDAGQADAINRGFRDLGDAEILAWLNADDILLPGTLSKVAAFFARHPEADLIYGDRLVINEEDRVIGRWILPEHDATVMRWIDYVPQETMFWRRRAWTKVGEHIDTDLDFAIDWDLLLRMQDAQCVIRHMPSLLGAFRVHSTQKTQARYADLGRQEIQAIRKRYWRGIGIICAQLAHVRYLGRHRCADNHYRCRHVQ